MAKLKMILDNIQDAINAKPTIDNNTQTGLFEGEPKTKKELVLRAILKRGRAICEEDLPVVVKDLSSFFEEYMNEDYLQSLSSSKYFKLLDLRETPDSRVVVVGDIHSDFYSLAAVLLKLSVSKYDYFEKAHIVFLGDYLDRGTLVFEHLLLLMDLKRILGGRMIMLKGNHEQISYNQDKNELESRVMPQDTCPVLNEYCGEDKIFLQLFGYFFKALPIYVYLKVPGQNILLTHAAIPRQIFLDSFGYDQETGAIVYDDLFLFKQHQLARAEIANDSISTMSSMVNNKILKVRNFILNDMIWGDPSEDKEKYQVAGRFQFGSSQFEAYALKNNLTKLFRSHEPESMGYKSYYENRLYTIFSTGGSGNNQSGYEGVNPAIAVIKGDGDYFIENTFIYKFGLLNFIDIVSNLFSGEFFNGKKVCNCSLNDDFYCTAEEALLIEKIFNIIKKGFEDNEDESEPESDESKQESDENQSVSSEAEIEVSPNVSETDPQEVE